MRKSAILFSAVLLLLAGCAQPAEEKPASIVFSQNPLSVTCDEALVSAGMSCSASWTASSVDSWINVVSGSGAGGEDLEFRVSQNSSESDRTGKITVASGSLSKSLTVCQYGSRTSSFISSTKVKLDSYEEPVTITVKYTGGWSVSAQEGDWFTTFVSGSKITVTPEVNFTGTTRTGSFKVSADDGSSGVKVSVEQSFDSSRMLGSTVFCRQLTRNMGGYVQSVSSDSYTELTDGLASFEMTCKWKDDVMGETSALQRTVFLLVADMTKVTILATLKDDKNESLAAGTPQTVRDQLAALQASRPSVKVWGGVNGDFFLQDKNNDIQGVMYRGGECLKGTFYTSVNTVFAVMKDGTAACLTQSEYAAVKGNIAEAVSGRQNLLQKGVFVGITGDALEPRTAAGVSEDGKTVYLLIVDGRHSTYRTGSYGASYNALQRVLKGAGAYEGINLDGGGSSSYVILSGGSFTLRNKPGNVGNAEREVMNGLAIVKK